MAHPVMFDRDDPVLARLRTLCLAFPGAAEKVSHGRPVFFTTKVFAVYGGGVKATPAHERYDHGLIFLPDAGELIALDDDPRILLPAYYGPSGWRMIDLAADDTGWDEVGEFLDASFRNTAGKRLIAELDAR